MGDPSSQLSSDYASVDINPGRVLRAIARIGYTPQSAICDIVDNSVAAGARTVAIHLEREPEIAENRRNSAARYIIADDGSGMDPQQLVAALGLGVDRDYGQDSLSKYGLGLKSASLSQGDRLEIVSGRDGEAWTKIVLDLPHIESTGRLECQITSLSEQDLARRERFLSGTDHGTIVTIEKIHKKNHPSIRKTRRALEQMLGVIYQYFLDDDQAPLMLQLDDSVIQPFDPLFKEEADRNGDVDDSTWDGRSVGWLEKLKPVVLDSEIGAKALFEATQLVHPPAFDNPAEIRATYMIGNQHYGFYVYRNKRLIRWADRFGGLIPTDQDLFAFRGRLLIDDTVDDVLNIDVKKSEVLLSEEAEASLAEAVYESRRKSQRAWKNAASILKRKANDDPISKANEALSNIDFPDILPTDPDDQRTEGIRKEREREEAATRPLKDTEREQVQRQGSRVVLVDYLDDNALWERAYDASLGTVVRLNRSHRFTRLFYDRFGEDGDVILLLHSLFLSLAVAESGAIRNLQDLDTDELEKIFQRYRDQASAAVYKVTNAALEDRYM